MKTNKVLLFLAVLLAANLAITQMMSCKQDNPKPTTPTKTGHTPDFIDLYASDRAHCTTSGYCNLAITSSVNTSMIICSSTFDPGSTCNEGCLDYESYGGTAEFEADSMREMCSRAVAGAFCLLNTGTYNADITVSLGSDTWTGTLNASEKVCFHTTSDCKLFEGCQ